MLDDGYTDTASLCQAYLAVVTNMLQRPHARRFLAEGGLLWRIALQYGPIDLYTAALLGPSSTATVYGRKYIAEWTEDILNDRKVGALVGNTLRSGSFWP